MQQFAGVGTQWPVVVLTTTVHSLEGLFVEQYTESVVACHITHQWHQQHVVVHRQVTLFVNRSQFKLVGGHLVVACLYGDTQFQWLHFEVGHKGCYPWRDGTEVMVFQLLVLWWFVSHQGATRQKQVGTGGIESLVHKEVLLFPSKVSKHLLNLGVEVVAYTQCSLVDGTQWLQERSLVVECFARVGYKYGGDTECVIYYKHRWRWIPSTVSAGFKGVADTSVGEGRGIRFLLNQQFARELFQHTTLAIVLHKGIVLLRCAVGQWLEPVRIVGHTQFDGPFLHACSHLVGNVAVEWGTVVDYVNQLGIYILGQVFEHFCPVEDILGKVFCRSLCRRSHLHSLLLESRFNHSES